MIEANLDLVKTSLLVGKDSKDSGLKSFIPPNIAFNNHISTVSRKQFHLSAKNKIDRGYYITDLSLTNPTCFRVRSKPYALTAGMLIDLNTYLFEIQEVYPNVEFDEKSDFYVVSTEHGERPCLGIEETIQKLKISKIKVQKDDEEGENTRKREKKKTTQRATPILKVRIMNPFMPQVDSIGEENSRYFSIEELNKKISTSGKIVREKEVIFLTSDRMEKGAVYSIGSHQNNQIVINDADCDAYFCQFYYNHMRRGWFVVEKHEESNQTDYSSSGTLICLKNFQQYKEEKIGSIGHKLEDGMEIFFNSHVLGVQLVGK